MQVAQLEEELHVERRRRHSLQEQIKQSKCDQATAQARVEEVFPQEQIEEVASLGSGHRVFERYELSESRSQSQAIFRDCVRWRTRKRKAVATLSNATPEIHWYR